MDAAGLGGSSGVKRGGRLSWLSASGTSTGRSKGKWAAVEVSGAALVTASCQESPVGSWSWVAVAFRLHSTPSSIQRSFLSFADQPVQGIVTAHQILAQPIRALRRTFLPEIMILYFHRIRGGLQLPVAILSITCLKTG